MIKKFPRLILTCLVAFSVNWRAVAKDIYISQNGSGVTNSVAWLNSSANWGSGASQINPGDTVHLTGVITANIILNGSGIPGSPITVLFDPNAMCSAPTLPNASQYMWIYASGLHDMVINGGVNGILECTQNGTGPAYGGTNAYQNGNLCGIYATGVNNFTIENLTISNLYNRLPSSADPGVGSQNSVAMSLSGNNIMVLSNNIYNSQDGIDYIYSGSTCSNVTINGNYLLGWNHGIEIATSGANVTPTLYNVMIRSNRLDGMDYYEDQTGSITYYHRDGVFFISEANFPANATVSPTSYYSGFASNIDVSYNFIGPGVNPKTSVAGTSAIFVDDYCTNQYSHLYIYNNIFTLKSPLQWADGFIDGGMASDSLVANNTMSSWPTSGTPPNTISISAGGDNYKILNNIVYWGTGSIQFQAQPTMATITGSLTAANVPSFAGCYSDYNVLPVGAGANAFTLAQVTCWGTSQQGWINYLIGTLAQWQALGPNFDPHSTTNVPILNTTTWVPLSTDTVARAQGTNLSSYFANDFYGTPRSATGAWDIGACAFVVPALTAPTGFHIVSQ